MKKRAHNMKRYGVIYRLRFLKELSRPGRSLGGNFDAIFIVIHTDPDEATAMFDGLGAEVYYNNFESEIDNSVDTTAKSTDYTYDRIIITDSVISDLFGDSGVYRYDIEYGLSEDETVAVSDHYPIYVELWCVRDMD